MAEKSEIAIDLNGKWKFDRGENFDEYLKELGAGFMVRKMATTLKPTMTIQQTGDTFITEINMGIKTETNTVTIGGTTEAKLGPNIVCKGSKVLLEGNKLLIEGNLDNGKHFKNYRFIENGELVQEFHVGEVICKRIFKKTE